VGVEEQNKLFFFFALDAVITHPVFKRHIKQANKQKNTYFVLQVIVRERTNIASSYNQSGKEMLNT